MSVGLVVDDDGGSEAAGADAAHFVEGVNPVRSGLSGLHPEPALEILEDPLPAFDVTGSPQANMDLVPAFRLQTEKMVKTGNAVQPGNGDSGFLGEVTHLLLRQIIAVGLHLLQNRNQAARGPRMPRQNLGDELRLHSSHL